MTMGYVARALVQVLASYAIVTAILSLVVAAAWPWLRPAPGCPPARAARRLFQARLLPASGGLAVSILTLAGYVWLEARTDAETVGGWALASALCGLVLVTYGIGRLAAAMVVTRRVERRLRGLTQARFPTWPRAYVIDSHFPIVALVGLVLARLFVARRVVDACSPEELEAILAHEAAHATQHDNLRRMAIAAAPDLLALLPVASGIEAAWQQASELAADDAASSRAGGGLPLASALVKVARLATTPSEPWPASALYRGESITERVHRLLDPAAARDVQRRSPRMRTLFVALAAAIAVAAVPVLHTAAERLLALGR